MRQQSEIHWMVAGDRACQDILEKGLCAFVDEFEHYARGDRSCHWSEKWHVLGYTPDHAPFLEHVCHCDIEIVLVQTPI